MYEDIIAKMVHTLTDITEHIKIIQEWIIIQLGAIITHIQDNKAQKTLITTITITIMAINIITTIETMGITVIKLRP